MHGGIVLCGGKSTRMGTSKALLPFGPETMLQRVVRLLSGVVSPIVVVAAVDQELPPLPSDVIITRDERDGFVTLVAEVGPNATTELILRYRLEASSNVVLPLSPV